MVKATKITLAAALLAAGTTLAMAQAGSGAAGGTGVEPPHGSDAHAPSAVQKQGDDTRGTPAPGASSQAAITGKHHKARKHTARKHMRSMPTGMNNNSTGNMNTKGTGRGTTGTGGPGGSGNR